MDICFNELSCLPHVCDRYEAHKLMMKFSETARQVFLRKIKKIRTDLFTTDIILSEGYSLHDWLFDRDFIGSNMNYREFLQGMISHPFIPESKEDDYLSTDFYFQDNENGIAKTKCQGLAAAYLTSSLSISFQSSPAWQKSKLEILEGDNTYTTHSVNNVFSADCFLKQDINCFISEKMLQEIGDSYLIKSSQLSDRKKCHISDDHGKRELIDFWLLLKNSPYVESAKSTGFYPKGSTFIKSIEPDSEIGVVHLSKDHPYTLHIQTTGRCYPETKRIAEILQAKYMRRNNMTGAINYLAVKQVKIWLKQLKHYDWGTF
jgi:hypothetical protein